MEAINQHDQTFGDKPMDNSLADIEDPDATIMEDSLVQDSQNENSLKNDDNMSSLNYSSIPPRKEDNDSTANFLLDGCGNTNDEEQVKDEEKEKDWENHSDDASDEESLMPSTNKLISSQQLRDELFPNTMRESMIATAELETRQSEESKEELKSITVKQTEVYNQSKAKHDIEIKNYETKITKLSKKKKKNPDDYLKLDFYQQKLESTKAVIKLLTLDFLNIQVEIKNKILHSPSEITKPMVNQYRKRLCIAASRVENRLPIYFKKDQIEKSLKNNRITVIKGKPGCGKSTQIPSLLYENNLVSQKKKMYMITPRLISAKQIFGRVMTELQDTPVDSLANYGSYCQLITSTEFKTKGQCPLVFSTDVEFYKRLLITGEIKPDDIAYLVIDEANSRKMYTDMIISLSRQLLIKQKDMKVVFLCTSFNLSVMSSYFGVNLGLNEKSVVDIDEKNYITEVAYMPLNGDTEKQVADVLQEIEERIYRSYKRNKCIKDGNILIFLNGASEVRSMYRKFEWLEHSEGLMGRLKGVDNLKTKYKLFMASGSNSLIFDEELFKENNCQETIKLIFSTKVLETSVTIPFLGFVVDFGKESVYSFDYSLGAQRKLLRDISKDTAEQREGRVGRTSNGVCFRIYKEEEFEAMDATTDSELKYKNIDLVIMSLIRVGLEITKSNKENIFFDLVDTDALATIGQVQKSKDESIVQDKTEEPAIVTSLTKLIMNFDLQTSLNEESVRRSLQMLNYMKLINENTFKEGEKQNFKIILAFGTEPKFGLALAAAITEYKTDAKKSRPWLLSAMIDVVATNMFNRTLPFDKKHGNPDSCRLHEETTAISSKYGDFAFNYYVFKHKLSEKPKDLGIHEGTLRKFSENQKLLRVKTQSLLKLSDTFFKTQNIENFPSVTEDQHYNAIIECLVYGYSTDISKYINNDLGYYHSMVEKPVCFSPNSAFRHGDAPYANSKDPPQFIVMSDVVAKDTILESMFSFFVPIHILNKYYKKQLSYLNSIDMDNIPSKIYTRDNLGSNTIHALNFRMYYIEQMLDKHGYVIGISEKDLEFRIAIQPRYYDEMVAKVEKLIEFIENSYINYTYELGLKNCRLNVGNGLAIHDIMSNKDGVSSYFFMVPRYIVDRFGSQVVLGKAPADVGPWDFLINRSKEYFGFDENGLEVWYDTTFTKVNYAPDSIFMNMKFTCKTVKDNEKVRALLRKVMESWTAEDDTVILKPELKFCERHLNRDVHCKPIQLRLLFSMAECTGKAIIKTNDPAAFNDLEVYFETLKKSPPEDSIFGVNFKLQVHKEKRSVHDKSIELTHLPSCLDELMIEAHFKSQIYLKFCKIEVRLDKSLEKEMTRGQLEDDLRSLLNRIIWDATEDDALKNQYNLYIYDKYVRPYKAIKQAEIRLNSDKASKAIIKALDKKHYNMMSMDGEENYRLGKQYTHVQKFDKPEFHVKKRIFGKIRNLLDQINKNIEDHLTKKYGAEAFKYREEIDKEKSIIDYPDDPKLNSIKDEENIKIRLQKGTDESMASTVESLLRNYFNGKEIHIKEQYFSFFFGPDGDSFLKQVQNSQDVGYTTFRRVENKSMIIVQELKKTFEDKIYEKCKELDTRKTKSFHLKLNHRDIRDKKYIEQVKRKLNEDFPGIKITSVQSYYGMIIIETTNDKIEAATRTLTEFTEEYFNGKTDNNKSTVKCSKCNQTGNVRRLLLCRHLFCTSCLQNSFFSQTCDKQTDSIKGLDQPFFFCPKEGCGEPLPCCDIFGFMPDKLVENVLANLIDNLCAKELLKDVVQCSSCKFFNRIEKKSREKQTCFKCSYDLVSSGRSNFLKHK